jgi:hypothetical protein
MKYNKKAILDYINGNDLEYDEEILEKDFDFMLDVLRLTKDKKTIKFCDKTLLNDPLFVYEVLEIFKEDKLFCAEFATSFIKKNFKKYTADYINVALKAIDINNDNRSYDLLDLGTYIYCAYHKFILKCIRELQDAGVDYEFHFGLIELNYPNDELFKKYIAKNMIKDMLNELNTSFDYYIKVRYNTPNYIETVGARQFILDFIRGRDEDLADYVELHLDLIHNKINELNKMIKEWKDEEAEIEEEVYEIIDAFCEQHIDISMDTCLKYIAKELNMPSLLDHTFESMNEHLIELGYEQLDISDVIEDKVDDIEKQMLLNKLRNGILLYIQNNKRKQTYEKIENINNLKLIKKSREITDIRKDI